MGDGPSFFVQSDQCVPPYTMLSWYAYCVLASHNDEYNCYTC